MFDEAESAHMIAVRNVFKAHRIIAQQRARISALKAAIRKASDAVPLIDGEAIVWRRRDHLSTRLCAWL